MWFTYSGYLLQFQNKFWEKKLKNTLILISLALILINSCTPNANIDTGNSPMNSPTTVDQSDTSLKALVEEIMVKETGSDLITITITESKLQLLVEQEVIKRSTYGDFVFEQFATVTECKLLLIISIKAIIIGTNTKSTRFGRKRNDNTARLQFRNQKTVL